MPLSSRGFLNKTRKDQHFADHGAEFGARVADDYEAKADNFLAGARAPDTHETARGSNGDIIRYNPTTEEFGVITASGYIKTYFKPDPAIHGYTDNLTYFRRQ